MGGPDIFFFFSVVCEFSLVHSFDLGEMGFVCRICSWVFLILVVCNVMIAIRSRHDL
jgi:hypothetical protein